MVLAVEFVFKAEELAEGGGLGQEVFLGGGVVGEGVGVGVGLDAGLDGGGEKLMNLRPGPGEPPLGGGEFLDGAEGGRTSGLVVRGEFGNKLVISGSILPRQHDLRRPKSMPQRILRRDGFAFKGPRSSGEVHRCSLVNGLRFAGRVARGEGGRGAKWFGLKRLGGELGISKGNTLYCRLPKFKLVQEAAGPESEDQSVS